MGIIFHRDRSFQGLNFLGEILQFGNLPEFLHKFLLMSCFLFADSILRVEMLSVIVRSKFSSGLNCVENKYVWRRNFFVEV